MVDDLDLQEVKPSSVTTGPGRSGVVKYELEWKNILTIANEPNLVELRQLAVQGELRASPFRSVCWAVFLGVLETPKTERWPEQRSVLRAHYRQIKVQFVLNPHEQTTDVSDDPLSQSKQSLWNQHFCDQELCAVIKQDVVRTFPGVDFFRKPAIQELMTNILFCYARQFPAMCYRQGMHEILAPLIFVIHSDQQALAHIQELHPDIDRNLQTILDPQYLEEDSYAIFSKIMAQIESFYRITDVVPTATGYFPAQTPGSPAGENPAGVKRKPEVEVVEQLNYIKDKILIKEDLHLHNRLLKLDIPLAIFGIRWLRLLFGREFALQDLLLLWDAIFGESYDLGLINYIVVAMLVRIRNKLIYSDYTTCLSYLMRYPSNIDIALIIRHALHMKSPNKYERPADAKIFLSSPSHQAQPQSKPIRPKTGEINHQKYSTLPAVHQRRGQLTVNDHPLQTRSSVTEDRQRTSSLPRNSGSMRMSTAGELRQAACLATKKAIIDSSQSDIRDPVVTDGYREDDPELLRIELQNAYNIMSVGRAKLLQYLTVLRRNIRPTNHQSEVQQSLEGIEEICSLLKPRYDTVFRIPAPIDTAMEANEDPQKVKKPLPGTARMVQSDVQDGNVQRMNAPPTSLNLTRSYNYDLDCRRNSSSQSNITQYEIPEDRYSKIATKKLGNKKEVEMNVITKNFSDRNRRHDDKDLPNTNPLCKERSE